MKETTIPDYQPGAGAYVQLPNLIKLRHVAEELEAPALPRTNNPLSGLLTSRFQGRGIDFSEVRAYQPGDDVRTIDWRVTARTRKPHTKLFQEEKERPVLILTDQSMSMFFGSRVRFKSVMAAEVAAVIAWLHLHQGDRVGGIVFSHEHHREVRPRRSKHSVLRYVHELHDFNRALSRDSVQQGQSYLGDALANVRRVAKHGSAVYLISDFRAFDDQAKRHLRQLAAHNDIVGIHITDPLERALPAPSYYTISDGNQKTRIDAISAANRKQFEDAFGHFETDLAAEFARSRVPLLKFSTTDDLTQRLSRSLNSARGS